MMPGSPRLLSDLKTPPSPETKHSWAHLTLKDSLPTSGPEESEDAKTTRDYKFGVSPETTLIIRAKLET